ncbi:hypothetical protein BH23BAC3_BH23BAC3_35030 [soil metagenome]
MATVGKTFSDPDRYNTINDLARRDARAMVMVLNKMKAGPEPFEAIYDSLKKLHGKAFEKYFREFLTGRNRRRNVIE